jgi:hypothetical protein
MWEPLRMLDDGTVAEGNEGNNTRMATGTITVTP